MRMTSKWRVFALFCALGLCFLCQPGLAGPAQSTEASSSKGSLFVEIIDVLQRNLPGKVELYPVGGGSPIAHLLREGKAVLDVPTGRYAAYTYVYDWDIPIMVDLREVAIEPGAVTNANVEVVEGGNKPLRAFDQDFDLVMDRVEVAAGTRPDDPDSFPNAEPIPFDSPVLSKEPGWYKGDLHVRSVHGGGTESVAELVARAEKAGLDFIAITDRNTMEACFDPAFESKKVVLIPALEWGTDDRGVALIYGPHTFPALTTNIRDDQGVCQRVQAQGGVFAIAHPCFPNAPWQRGLSFVNAFEVWCRDYRAIPPVGLGNFVSEYQRRKEGKLIYSISRAVSLPNLSANGQAAVFWDYELVRGLKACPIGGSLSSSPKVPMGSPLTYVYAPEKSVRGILYGLRLGRTMVTSGVKGPFVLFTADVKEKPEDIVVDPAQLSYKKDDLIIEQKTQVTIGAADVGIGGVIPLGLPVDLLAQVKDAKGMKLEILRNGWPILTKKITASKVEVFKMTDTPTSYSVYRVRIVRVPEENEKGYGPLDVAAMTGPIYAQDIVPIDPTQENPFDIWIRIESDKLEPVQVTATMEENGKKWVRTQGGPVQPYKEEEFQLPPGAQVKTLNVTPVR